MHLTPGSLSSNQRKHHTWGVVWCGGPNLQTKLSRRCDDEVYLRLGCALRSSRWVKPNTRSQSLELPYDPCVNGTQKLIGRAAGTGCGGHHTSGHYGVTGHRGRGRCRHFYGRMAFFGMQGVEHLPTFLLVSSRTRKKQSKSEPVTSPIFIPNP